MKYPLFGPFVIERGERGTDENDGTYHDAIIITNEENGGAWHVHSISRYVSTGAPANGQDERSNVPYEVMNNLLETAAAEHEAGRDGISEYQPAAATSALPPLTPEVLTVMHHHPDLQCASKNTQFERFGWFMVAYGVLGSIVGDKPK